MGAPVAKPKYKIGDDVLYRDHQKRLQTGIVKRIEASWSDCKDDPLIIYTLTHPTYRGNRHYASEARILERYSVIADAKTALKDAGFPVPTT